MKKVIKITIILMLIVFIANTKNVFAATGFSISEIFTRSNFGSSTFTNLEGIKELINELGTGLIQPIGYLVFAIVTVGLGIKYIWSGVEGKTKIKETLPAFIIAVVFFYLASSVSSFATGAFEVINSATSIEDATSNIWATFAGVAQVLAFGGLVFIGIKYLFESSEGKAKLKERLAPMLLGIIFVFCAAGVVNYIIAIGNATIN